ncbi:hypothetical protein A9G28_11180 [Gilliamella sp. Fer1-1]|jgi:uncharacterized coiled-coil protein SlyX|uniref:hypothetical protein n=1 Tax=unclassified Gilliamella TaxID=2685620 RepID=UPI00080EDBE4|nr:MULTISPECIES: hypothetical protein [Gilliamella]MCO6553223.1 hypothetical protein [Gilliamella sp.]OCG45865.1 hypothetical protein A9G28_11180 [Gilliamella apicola]
MLVNNKTLLKNSIKTLKMILKEQHDVMDSSKRKELEEIIQKLEESQEQYTSSQLLDIFDRCITLIPAVIQLIEFISKK